MNTTDLFHVELRHWTALRGREGARGPRERAFHSATVIGDYMVVYGEPAPPTDTYSTRFDPRRVP